MGSAHAHTHTQSVRSSHMTEMVLPGWYFFWSGIVSLSLNSCEIHASYIMDKYRPQKIPTWKRPKMFVQLKQECMYTEMSMIGSIVLQQEKLVA